MNAQKEDSQSLRALIARPVYAGRFKEVLHERTDQFVSSLLQVGASMPDVEPKSIIAAAMTAAALDLPINKNLGFAWIVPYVDNKKGRKLAQFQMGYKGYIQLGLRTSQYQRMNARLINAEAFKGYDDIGEPIIDWNELDETQEPVGYCFAWRLTNGFSKICYWPKAKVQAHARRYSQAFRKNSGPWETHPHEMALKTVIKNELAKWGILSIQMERAYREDSAVRVDDESEPLQLDDFSEAPESGGREIPPTTPVPSSTGASVSLAESGSGSHHAEKAAGILGSAAKVSDSASLAGGGALGVRQDQMDRTSGTGKPDSVIPSVAPPANPLDAGDTKAPSASVPASGTSRLATPSPASSQSVAGDVSKPKEEPVKTSVATTAADAPATPKRRRKTQLDPQSDMITVLPVTGPMGDSPFALIATGCEAHGISFETFRKWIMKNMPHIQNADSMGTWNELPEKWVRLWLKSGELLYQEVKR